MSNTKPILSKENLVAAAVLIIGGITTASAQTTHYHSNGENACATGRLDSTWIDLCVYTNKTAGQGGGKQPIDAFLHYYAYGPNGYSYGYGRIPASAVNISNNHATLSFNAVSSQDFYQEGPLSGAISLSWAADGLYVSRSHNNGKTTYSNAGIRWIFNGSYETESATATGAVFGYSFTASYGSIGTTRNLSITIEK